MFGVVLKREEDIVMFFNVFTSTVWEKRTNDRPALIIHSKKVLEDIEAGENCTTKCVFRRLNICGLIGFIHALRYIRAIF